MAIPSMLSALSFTRTYERGKLIVEAEIYPRQRLSAHQAAIGHKIVARTDIKALRKNVLAKCLWWGCHGNASWRKTSR